MTAAGNALVALPGRAVDRAIGLYQERLSPRKGWSCAYGVAHGDATCSGAVRDIVARRGLVRGTVPVVLQLLACYQAASLLRQHNVQGVCCCGGIPIPFRF
jgi:putative component of membrane protein insertase Oxa1/YidC/SpoIIIJ protein YidD